MKSYGGFLPIELRSDDEYHKNRHLVRLNNARSAIVLATKLERCSLIYIPVYLCESVKNHLFRYNILVEYYNINENLLPVLNSEQINKIQNEGAIVLITNFYGIIENNIIENLVEKYHNVIIDNTQAFFNDPIETAYTVYSCRKFIGVSDGAYLVGPNCSEEVEHGLLPSFSGKGSEFLLQSYESGTNNSYDDYLNYEDRITAQGIMRMSQLTQAILKNADYDSIKKRRYDNFHFLTQQLKNVNELKISEHIEYPMIYPLVIKNDKLRDKLVKKGIFVSQWWKWCLSNSLSNEYEKYISKYLIPLPIDQRYNTDDMEQIVRSVISAIS